MDWFSWLSRTNLEPCLIHDYALSFSHNELEHEDIPYFNHEFLQSMGISIAKHRLEILKLARKKPPRSISRAAVAIKKTSKCFSDRVRAWINPRGREESSSRALVLKRSSNGIGKWRSGFLKREKKRSYVMQNNNVSDKQEMLLLTNGTPCRRHLDSFEYSPMVFDYSFKDWEDASYRGNGPEEIKWDTMFQCLKPT